MENSFPVMHSTLSGDALHDFVETHYDVGRVTRCKMLTRGLNDTYRVDTERNKFILRVYRTPWRSQADVYYELDVLEYLSRNGVPVSAPLRGNSGQLAHVIHAPEGARYVTLFTYAPGTIPQLDRDISFQYGKTVARIHKLTDEFSSIHPRFQLNLTHLLDDPLETIRSTMTEYGGDIHYVASWVERIKCSVPNDLLDYGFCHGDFHDWNTHWEDGTLTVFDFDCCGPGFRAYDLAVFLWNLKTNYKGQVADNWMPFLKGYTDTRPLQEIDRAAIPFFVAARRIWLAGIYLGNEDVFGTAIINKGFFRSLVDQLKADEQDLNE